MEPRRAGKPLLLLLLLLLNSSGGASMSQKENKSCVVALRFTGEQYAPFMEPIALSGVKPARFFRELVLSRSPAFEESTLDKKRLVLIFEKAGSALNRVAYLANSAPYKGAMYQSKYVHWMSRLSSIQMLLQAALPTTEPPAKAKPSSNSSLGLPGEHANKDHIISFRLTQAELALFEVIIKRTGCTPSYFFRELILKPNPTFKEFTGFKKRIVFIVNKSGNNITQLAYVASSALSRGIISDELHEKWLVSLVSIEVLLLAGIGYAD